MSAIAQPNARGTFSRQGTDLQIRDVPLRVDNGGRQTNFPGLLVFRWVVRYDNSKRYADGQPIRDVDHLSFRLVTDGPGEEPHQGGIDEIHHVPGVGWSIAACSFV